MEFPTTSPAPTAGDSSARSRSFLRALECLRGTRRLSPRTRQCSRRTLESSPRRERIVHPRASAIPAHAAAIPARAPTVATHAPIVPAHASNAATRAAIIPTRHFFTENRNPNPKTLNPIKLWPDPVTSAPATTALPTSSKPSRTPSPATPPSSISESRDPRAGGGRRLLQLHPGRPGTDAKRRPAMDRLERFDSQRNQPRPHGRTGRAGISAVRSGGCARRRSPLPRPRQTDQSAPQVQRRHGRGARDRRRRGRPAPVTPPRADIGATVSGTQVNVAWNWGGQSAFLDMCEIHVDRGDGKASSCSLRHHPRLCRHPALPGRAANGLTRPSTASATNASANGANR